MKDLSLKMKIAVVIGGIIVIGTIGLYMYNTSADSEDYAYYEEDMNIADGEDTEENVVPAKIMVHVTGQVKEQGVVLLDEGSRIVDAIEAAGGETDDADLAKLNLAYVLNDGEKIYVPSKAEQNQEIEYVTTSSGDTASSGGDSMSSNSSIININTAGQAELMELPGIGESIANKIIAYREENGKFKTIEDIKNVPGIGDSKFANIKDMIKSRVLYSKNLELVNKVR